MPVYRTLAAVFVLLFVALGTSLLVFARGAQAQEEVTIDVGDFWYCAASFEEGTCETTISAGDTVVWDFSSGINSHDVTDCGVTCDDPTSSPLFDSGTVAPGGTYSHTFDDAGAFLYLCEVHPTLMFGRIVVQPAVGPESATQTPSVIEPGDIIPPGSTPLGGLPTSGQGPRDDASASWWPAIVVLVSGGALLALLGAAGHRATRRS